MSLVWQKIRNLENSLVEFLNQQVISQNLTTLDEDGKEITVLITTGFASNEDWTLPVISVYVDSKTSPRLSVGSNCRLDTFLMIVDIRGIDIGNQIDLTEWVQDTINDGWDFNEYSPNPSDPDNALKNKTGHVAIDFLSNTAVRIGDNADKFEKYRQNISINCYIS